MLAVNDSQRLKKRTMSTVSNTAVSPAEYLEFERNSELKHEYRDGEIVQMIGGTQSHNFVEANLLRIILTKLVDKTYDVYPGNMRVKVSEAGIYTYPDIAIVKGKSQLEDEHGDTLLNPAVIFEVLSPSTESYDRGQKFEHYRNIDSLAEYVLVAQDRICIERFTKQDGGQWLLQDYKTPEDVMHLDTIECDFPLADVYHKVPLQGERKAQQPESGE